MNSKKEIILSLPDTINIHYDFTFYNEEKNILRKLAFINSFKEISEWVKIHSASQRYIANPSTASDTDRLDCLVAIQRPIFLALKNIKKRRKNGRDRRLITATNVGDYFEISCILASSAASYWRDHGFLKKYKV